MVISDIKNWQPYWKMPLLTHLKTRVTFRFSYTLSYTMTV